MQVDTFAWLLHHWPMYIVWTVITILYFIDVYSVACLPDISMCLPRKDHPWIEEPKIRFWEVFQRWILYCRGKLIWVSYPSLIGFERRPLGVVPRHQACIGPAKSIAHIYLLLHKLQWNRHTTYYLSGWHRCLRRPNDHLVRVSYVSMVTSPNIPQKISGVISQNNHLLLIGWEIF